MRIRGVSGWWSALALLVAVRLAIPLAAYADAGRKLPGIPRWTSRGLEGDANGFYAATRDFMAAWGRMPRPLLALLALAALAAALLLVRAWRGRPELRPWLAPAALLGFGSLVCVDIHWMRATGAAVFGWPLVWGLVMLPYRVVFGLDPATAWDFGFALSLVWVALTVVAVGYLGRNATGRRWCGLVAAAVVDVLAARSSGVIAGHGAWANGQWDVDVGLHLYDEPLSTLLVTTGAALLLSPRLTPMRLSLAGCALSVASLVKVSNVLVAAVAARDRLPARPHARRRSPYLAGALCVRAGRARLLAALVPVALRQPKRLAARPVRPRPRRLGLDALDDLRPAHAGDRRAARGGRRVRAARGRGKPRWSPPSCS